MSVNDDKIIYLDLEFVSRKYEQKIGGDPAATITKQQGGNARISALFAHAGVTTQESRTFSVTSRQMFQSIWYLLIDEYDNFEEFENYAGTKVLWLEGELTLGEWKNSGSKEAGYQFYQLNHNGERTAFVANKSYLAPGFSEIFGASSALKGNIGIPVKCLARVMWHVDDAKNYVACPYVIVEQS